MSKFNAIPPLNASSLLRKHGLRPDKRLGQNFLQDPLALEDIVNTAEIQSTDTVLEIGAGLGGLTRYLALVARQVIALELDGKLIPILKTSLAGYSNVRLVQADVLKVNPAELIDQPDYIVAANIPYYITSAVIRHLLESDPKPRRLVLTVQKEVAQRICAQAGEMSLLALSVQVYGRPTIAAQIPAQAFFPSPKVDSAVVRIDVQPTALIQPGLLSNFFRLIKAGFSQKRKTLRNSLSAGLAMTPDDIERLLNQSGVDPKRRAESLSIPEWERLAELYQIRGGT